jgi:hypothetical protein
MPTDLWEAQYNQRVMRQDFTVQDLMMEHQAMAYVLHMLPHTVITAQEQVARGRYDDVPGATRELVREQMTRKLYEYRAAA